MALSLLFLVCMATTAAAQVTVGDTVCGETSYFGPEGNISSPNFPRYYISNLDCYYNVYGSAGSTLLFVFRAFHTQETVDYVTINCQAGASFPEERHSGHSLPSPISMPSCSHGLIYFHTDFETVNTGFYLDYYVIDSESTSIQSETTDFRETTYEDTTVGTTDFKHTSEELTTANEITTLELKTTAAEETTIEGTTTVMETTTEFRQSTGQETTTVEETTTITTEFRQSTAEETTTGQDVATVSAFKQSTAEEATTIEEIKTTFPATTLPVTTLPTTTLPTTEFIHETTLEDGTTRPASTSHFAETTPFPEVTTDDPVCGDTAHYGPTGIIHSPNYPLPYSRSLDCNYYVYASNGSSLSFFFKALDTEANFDTVTISCPTNASFAPRRYFGTTLPDPVSIPWCSLGLVNFQSDEALGNTYSGFILNYYVSDGGCGETVYNESTEHVTSPNFPANYGNDHSCQNIIWARQRSTFHLNFLSFSLDSCCNCDWLEIRCLDNSEYGPYKYCGENSFGSLDIAQCSQTLLWFRSDSSLNAPGFDIQYNVNPVGGQNQENAVVADSIDFPKNTPTPPGCGYDTYTGPIGNITSPNYPDNYFDGLKCQYFINASTGGSIALIFEHFDVQEDKDYVDIGCETNTSFTVQRFTGHALPSPLSIPWCSQGGLYFFTDTITAYTGFSIDYYISAGGCGNTVYTESFGNITSPNYPSNYGDNQDCYNIIYAEQPSHFHIEYIYFSVQGSNPCQLDYVEISCLDNNPSNKHRFCGSTVYSIDFYQCTQVLVLFHSDSSTNFEGFYLEYNIMVELGCGEESFYGPLGAISSPNFPQPYNNSLYCDYSIYTGSSDGSIAIVFNALFTEECCDIVTISCPTNSSYSAVTYSGSLQNPPEPVSIPWCSQGNVNFRTDSTISLPGFNLDYYVSVGGCGNTIYTEVPGSISSPNHPSIYGDNQNCSNIIWVEKATNFNVRFLHMDVEECCDHVELSCLDSNSTYGTHRFSGTTIPDTQNITECTRILVWFFSDHSSGFTGFNLEYLVAPLGHGNQ